MPNQNLEWCYLQQWRQRQYIKLQEHRTVYVDCELDESSEDVPQVITLPEEVELTNRAICKWLSDEYGWLVADWRVVETPETLELI